MYISSSLHNPKRDTSASLYASMAKFLYGIFQVLVSLCVYSVCTCMCVCVCVCVLPLPFVHRCLSLIKVSYKNWFVITVINLVITTWYLSRWRLQGMWINSPALGHVPIFLRLCQPYTDNTSLGEIRIWTRIASQNLFLKWRTYVKCQFQNTHLTIKNWLHDLTEREMVSQIQKGLKWEFGMGGLLMQTWI